MPGRSPCAIASASVVPAEPSTGAATTRSAGAPDASTPDIEPVRPRRVAGRDRDRLARREPAHAPRGSRCCAACRAGMTPVPPGVSVPSVSRSSRPRLLEPPRRQQGRAVIARAADLERRMSSRRWCAVEVLVAHRDRARPLTCARDVGLEPRQDVVAAHLRQARARHAAGMHLDPDAARAAPSRHSAAPRPYRPQRIEDELRHPDARRRRAGRNAPRLMPGTSSTVPAIELHAAPAHAAGGGARSPRRAT